MRCLLRLPVAALVSIVVLLLPFAAAADSGSESQFVSDTNSARSSHGLPHYAVAGDMTAVARRWAAHMAAHHELAHNPSFTSEVCCWSHVGENVGVGPNVSSIQRAFMNSASHRDNILSSSYTQVGIGTARGSDGRLYVDELFRRPTSAAPRTAHPHRAAPALARPATHTPVRASRSAVRRPRIRPVHRPSARELFLSRLAAARVASAVGYGDPVGGALAYVLVVQRLAG